MADGRGTIREDLRGYVAASLGALLGGLVGLTVGRFVGVPLAARAADGVTDSGDADGGIEEVLQALGVSIGKVVLAGLTFILAVLLVLWLGVVGGCWIALRLSGAGRAARTALWAGCLGLPIAFLTVWAAQVVAAPEGTTAAWVTYGAAAIATACAARRFT